MKDRERIYYTIWLRKPESTTGITGAFVGFLYDKWELVTEWEARHLVYQRDSIEFLSMDKVREALASEPIRSYIEKMGCKYLITKHTTEIIENTIDSPLTQLAKTAGDDNTA